MDTDGIYQRLGELVVSFQWIENLLHQIAWVLIDPEWRDDPRKQTAGLWFRRLLDLVSTQYNAYIDAHEIDDAEDYKRHFQKLIVRCHAVADDRNRIIHSTFVELKSGGQLRGLLRSKIKTEVAAQEETSLVFDQECLDENSFDAVMTQIAETGFALGLVHRQLIHWQSRVKRRKSLAQVVGPAQS